MPILDCPDLRFNDPVEGLVAEGMRLP